MCRCVCREVDPRRFRGSGNPFPTPPAAAGGKASPPPASRGALPQPLPLRREGRFYFFNRGGRALRCPSSPASSFRERGAPFSPFPSMRELPRPISEYEGTAARPVPRRRMQGEGLPHSPSPCCKYKNLPSRRSGRGWGRAPRAAASGEEPSPRHASFPRMGVQGKRSGSQPMSLS